MAMVMEPPDHELGHLFRQVVLGLRGRPSPAGWPVRLDLGRQLDSGVTLTLPGSAGRWDHALRSDIIAALVHKVPGEAVIRLSRAGVPCPHDADLLWLSAARHACAEAGRDLTFVVVTRTGWFDPRSGVCRTWPHDFATDR